MNSQGCFKLTVAGVGDTKADAVQDALKHIADAAAELKCFREKLAAL